MKRSRAIKRKDPRGSEAKWKTVIESQEWRTLVERGAEKLGHPLNSRQIDQITLHALELMKWNKTFNITAIVEPEAVAVKHYVDSIALASYIPDNSRVIDLGSGGGFPGIPLKIVKPSINLVMVDASRKRVSFLNHICRVFATQWGFEGIMAIHSRGELLGKDETFSRSFDIAVSRAFTNLADFTKMASLFLKPEGVVIAMKGDVEEDELTGLKRLTLDGNGGVADGNGGEADGNGGVVEGNGGVAEGNGGVADGNGGGADGNGAAAVEYLLFTYQLPFEGHRRTIVKVTLSPSGATLSEEDEDIF